MNLITRWVLKRIAKKLIKQGYSHRANLEAWYKIMQEALDEEFIEDNFYGLRAFSQEVYNAAWADSPKSNHYHLV